MRFPVCGATVTLTIEEDPNIDFTAEDIDAISEFLAIWRRGQARVDAARQQSEGHREPEYQI